MNANKNEMVRSNNNGIQSATNIETFVFLPPGREGIGWRLCSFCLGLQWTRTSSKDLEFHNFDAWNGLQIWVARQPVCLAKSRHLLIGGSLDVVEFPRQASESRFK